VNCTRSALCYGNRSFIPELGVLPRATSRVLSIATTVTSVGAPCEPAALGAAGTFVKVFCRLIVKSLAICLAVASCQQSEPKSPRFKPNQADWCSAKPCTLVAEKPGSILNPVVSSPDWDLFRSFSGTSREIDGYYLD
jgi:hypothetical protein